MPETSQIPPPTTPVIKPTEPATKTLVDHGAASLTAVADRPSSDEIADRLSSTMGQLLTNSVEREDLLIGISIYVTAQGVVYWDSREDDQKESTLEGRLQMGAARLAVSHALGTIGERMRQKMQSHMK
jgi:hypothetical protein